MIEQPHSEIVRRTFNINNFESLTIEGQGVDPNPQRAHLFAHRDCLVKAQSAMVRIFNIRKQHGNSGEYDDVTYSVIISEIQGIDYELQVHDFRDY